MESKASQTIDGNCEMKAKCQSVISTLTQEVESLKVVVDMRNAEIARLKQSNAELEQQVSYWQLNMEMCFVKV